MENNFIQMAASAGHAVAYTIGPIFKHIIDCEPNASMASRILSFKASIVSGCRRNTYHWRHSTNNSPTV